MGQPSTWWPSRGDALRNDRVGIITVNWNTRALVALLIWSLHRVLRPKSFDLLVIDNGSSDGSPEFLQGCADLGLCSVLANEKNQHHGPAINQGISEFARRQAAGTAEVSWIWILDSDCVVVDADVLDLAAAAAVATDAAVLGEMRWDPWHKTDRLAAHSLWIDPGQAWRPSAALFEDGGDPDFAFQQSCLAAGYRLGNFPFTAGGHVIHRGRASLAEVAERRDTQNPLYAWSLDHHEPHFDGVSGADAAYARQLAEFEQNVGLLRPERVSDQVKADSKDQVKTGH
jgi:glycosyltransferase involved in cell wall biosynthesis